MKEIPKVQTWCFWLPKQGVVSLQWLPHLNCKMNVSILIFFPRKVNCVRIDGLHSLSLSLSLSLSVAWDAYAWNHGKST